MSVKRALNRVLGEYRVLRHNTHARGCKPRRQQAYEMLQLLLRGSFTPEEYVAYGFCKKGTNDRTRLRYLSNSARIDVLLPVLNNSARSGLLDDKWHFHSHYRDSPVPIADVYGIYKRRAGVDIWGDPLTSPGELRRLLLKIRPESLVVKPARGCKGRDILIIESIRYDGGIRFSTLAHRTLTFDDLTDHLETYRRKRFDQGFLLEGKLSQHRFLHALNPHTLNHFRVVTLLTYENSPQVRFASLYTGRRGLETANISGGGIAIHIDPATGVMGGGRTKVEFGGDVFTAHPDSGTEFAGVRIPFWDEVVDVAKKTAAFTPDLRMVGWDILHTPGGPVVIEGNPRFGIVTPQACAGGYVDEDFREELLKFGISLPTEVDFRGIRPSLVGKALRRSIRF